MKLFKKSEPRSAEPVEFSLENFRFVTRNHPLKTVMQDAYGPHYLEQAYSKIFNQEAAREGADGFYNIGNQLIKPGNTRLRFRNHGEANDFLDILLDFVRRDLDKIQNRRAYCNSVQGKADNGLLSWELDIDGNATDITAFYPAGQAVLAAGTRADYIDACAAWVTHGILGDASGYAAEFRARSANVGSFPLGRNTVWLFYRWQQLVPGAPVSRGWAPIYAAAKYSSDLGGRVILEEIITALNTRQLPPQQDPKWYDLALYVFASIMAVQAFTDGNKRMARMAYAWMLLCGEVEPKFPSNAFGANLADMS